MAETNIIAQLPEIEWRGLTAPCSTAPFTVTFDLAPRMFFGTDGYGHENTGRQSTPFQATLLFLNTVRDDAFPDLYTQWVDACVNDKSVDWLLHPLLGLTRARVQSFAVQFEAPRRAGVVVDVTWVETLEDPDTRVPFVTPTVAPEAAAVACDEALSAVGISYPQPSTAVALTGTSVTGTGTAASTAIVQGSLPKTPTLENATSLEDAYRAVKGQLFSASLSASAALNRLLGIVRQLIEDVDALKDHDAWAARWNLSTFYNTLKRIQADAERLVARATATKVTKKDTTLDEFARQTGNSLSDIMQLNVGALRSPIVLKGTTLRYYTGAKKVAI